MKNIILIAIISSIVSLASASTTTTEPTNTTYITTHIGSSIIADGGFQFEDGYMGSIAVGKRFKEGKFALELELNHQINDYSVKHTTYTTIPGVQGTGDGTPEIVPQFPGAGHGHAWGWHRNNPTIPAIIGTPGTDDITTKTDSILTGQLDRTALMVNVQYRLINESVFTPYALGGIGAVYVDFDGPIEFRETDCVYQLGLGLDVECTERISIAAEARYSDIAFKGYQIGTINYLLGLTIKL